MESTAAEVLAAPRALEARTLCEAFQLTAAERPDQVALRTPGDGVTITYREYAERVRRIAGGLASVGVGRRDTVALMLFNRPEFNLVDTAALHLGAVPFSVYNTSAPEQIEYLFSNAGNRIVVTERAFLPQVQARLGAARPGSSASCSSTGRRMERSLCESSRRRSPRASTSRRHGGPSPRRTSSR